MVFSGLGSMDSPVSSILKCGSLQSLDWTNGLDWWTGLRIIFMLSNESLPVGLHLET